MYIIRFSIGIKDSAVSYIENSKNGFEVATYGKSQFKDKFMSICTTYINPNQYQSILLIVHEFKHFTISCFNVPTYTYSFLLRNVVIPNRISPAFAENIYLIGSFFSFINNNRINSLTNKIKERGGSTETLLEEDFVTLYESILLVTDAIARKKSYSGALILENIQQTYSSNLQTSEIDNAQLSNSYYITKGFYIGKFHCTKTNIAGSVCLDYQTRSLYAIPSPVFSNGYDLTVYIYMYIYIYLIDIYK